MSWKDRLRKTIKLISPEGSEFDAFWRGNPRELIKKLGVFTFPAIKGAKVQDLDIAGTRYPLTIFFEGDFHDREGDRFFRACTENGKWKITHPVRGNLKLQLVSVSENMQPVSSANVTRIDTEWIESLADGATISKIEYVQSLDNQAVEANQTASDQFVRNIRQDTAEERASLIDTAGKVIRAVKKLLFVVQRFSLIPPEIDAILRGAESTLADVSGVNGDLLAGQIQALVQTYTLAQETTNQALQTFTSFNSAIFALVPGVPTSAGINVVAVQELTLSASVVGFAQASTIGGINTRAEALGLIDEYFSYFNGITDKLDETQELYQDNFAEVQYFSQSQSYSDNLGIISQAINFLLTQLFDLSIEKRFILNRSRAPIEITVSEYGTLGENDINLDLFIASNNLKGDDIRVLPAGREVVVYA